MGHLVIGSPDVEPVTLEEAKEHLRIIDTITTEIPPEDPEGEPTFETSHPDDDYIGNLITAAREWGETYQGQSWITRTNEYYIDQWPQSPLKLPRGPVQEIVSVTYTTSDGTEKTLDVETYRLDPAGRFCLAAGKAWPGDQMSDGLGIKITYNAGYGNDASDVPKRYRQAMLLLIGHWYEHREEVVVGSSVNEMPAAAEMLLTQDRVMPV